MVDRITITTPTHMPLDGQWQVVLPGSVIDVPDAGAYSTKNTVPVRGGGGTLASHGKPTPVRNIRTA